MVSCVILVQKATPETITQFHDQLQNELPNIRGKWHFLFKIFRNNPYAVDENVAAVELVLDELKFLYTLVPSYLSGASITLINRRLICVAPTLIEEEVKASKQTRGPRDEDFDEHLYIPDEHLTDGATTGFNDPFDVFVSEKLQSLWTLRQLVKGDGGNIYELENGNLTIRTSNVFLHGNFRGLLIEIDLTNHAVNLRDSTSFEPAFRKVCDRYKIPEGTMSCSVLDPKFLDKYGDICLQYLDILNF